jgi:hypothetical protein
VLIVKLSTLATPTTAMMRANVYVHFHLSSWIGGRCADGGSVASYRAFADGALEYRDLTKANDGTAEMQASRHFRDWLDGDHVPARALRDQSRKS